MILERLMHVLKLKGFLVRGGKKKLAELTTYKPGSITDFLKGKQPLGDKFIRLVCEKLQVSEVWLRTGEGNMEGNSPEDIDRKYKEAIALAENGKYQMQEPTDQTKKPETTPLEEIYLRFFRALSPEEQEKEFNRMSAKFSAELRKEGP